MNKIFPLIFFFISLIYLFGCTEKKESISQKVVLRVDDQTMTSGDFAKKLAARLSKYDALIAKESSQISQTKKSIEREFLVQSIIKKYAVEKKIAVEKSEIDLEINKMRSSFPDDYLFRQELSKQGVSLFQLQNDVALKILEGKVFKELSVNIKPPAESELIKYYNDHLDRYSFKEKINLKQIVLSSEAAADKIQTALKDRKSSFETLAQTFSIGPEGKDNGGALGWIEKGTLEVFDKAFSLPLNTPSQTFESPYGFHIFLVTAKVSAGQKPYIEVKSQIIRQFLEKSEQAIYNQWLSEQIKKLNYFKDTKLIDSLNVETRESE